MRYFLGWWYLLGLLMAIIGILIAYSEHESGPFRTLVTVSLAGAGIWLFSRVVGVYIRDYETVFMWRVIAYTVAIFSPLAIGGMCISAGGGMFRLPRKYLLTSIALWSAGVPVFLYGLISGKIIIWVKLYPYGMADVYGPWHRAFDTWLIASALVALAILWGTWKAVPKKTPFAKGTAVLGLSILIPLLSSLVPILAPSAAAWSAISPVSISIVFSFLLIFAGLWMLRPPALPYSLASEALSRLSGLTVLMIGLDGRIVWTSRKHAPDNVPRLVGINISELPDVIGVKAPPKWKNLWRDPAGNISTELTSPGGKAFSVRTAPMRDSRWKPYARLIVIQEITAYKEAMENLSRRSEALQDLAEIGREMYVVNEGLDSLLSLILKRTKRIFRADDSILYLFDPKRKSLRTFPGTGEDPGGEEIFLNAFQDRHGKGALEKITLERQPLLLKDYQTWPERRDDEDTRHLRAVMGVPLTYQGNFLGILSLSSRTPGKFDYDDLELLELFSHQAAAAIRNVYLYREIKQSEQEIKQILDNASDAICLLDSDLRILETNKEAESLFGRTQEELYGRTYCEFLTPESRESASSACENLARRESVRWKVLEVARPDGSQAVVELNASMLSDNRVIAVFRDISGRLKAEESIRRREEELRTLHKVALEISKPRPLREMIPLIVRKGVEMVGGQGGGLYLLDEERQMLRLQYVLDPLGRELAHRDQPISEGIAGKVARSGKVSFLNNYDKWEGRAETWKDVYFSSIIAVPLVWEGKVIGVQTVAGEAKERPFNEEDAHLLSLFAQYVATVIVRQRTVERMEANQRKLNLLYRMSKLLSESLDMDEVLAVALDQTMSAVRADAGVVWMSQTKDGQQILVPTLIKGVPEKWYESLYFAPGEGTIGSAFADGKPLYVRDVMNSPFWREKNFQGVVGDAIAFPLLSQGEAKGVLEVYNMAGNGNFPEPDTKLLSALQDLLEAAFTNAYLHQQTQSLLSKLEAEVEERTKELKKKQAELKRLSYLMMGREARMMELKTEIRKLRLQVRDDERK